MLKAFLFLAFLSTVGNALAQMPRKIMNSMGAAADKLSGQNTSAKRAFVSLTLEYLEILNDSLIFTSLSKEQDTTTYFIKQDSLFLKYDYTRTGAGKDGYYVEWQAYKILYHNKDSFFLVNNKDRYAGYSVAEDTLRFVNLETLKEPITSFKYLNIDLPSSFGGSRRVSIDGLGKVIFEKGQRQLPEMNEVFIVTKGVLTRAEFNKFLKQLTYFLPGKLRPFRGGCQAMDAGSVTIHIQYNNKSILSKGCSLKWPHAFLVNYLYDLDENKGFVKQLSNPKSNYLPVTK